MIGIFLAVWRGIIKGEPKVAFIYNNIYIFLYPSPRSAEGRQPWGTQVPLTPSLYIVPMRPQPNVTGYSVSRLTERILKNGSIYFNIYIFISIPLGLPTLRFPPVPLRRPQACLIALPVRVGQTGSVRYAGGRAGEMLP